MELFHKKKINLKIISKFKRKDFFFYATFNVFLNTCKTEKILIFIDDPDDSLHYKFSAFTGPNKRTNLLYTFDRFSIVPQIAYDLAKLAFNYNFWLLSASQKRKIRKMLLKIFSKMNNILILKSGVFFRDSTNCNAIYIFNILGFV
jgi:hypothetical protein